MPILTSLFIKEHVFFAWKIKSRKYNFSVHAHLPTFFRILYIIYYFFLRN